MAPEGIPPAPRRPRGMRSAWIAAGCLALVAVADLQARATKLSDYMDRPTAEWREGPVRYIITKWEDDEYKALERDDDRARFIENFWKRRDETPRTPGNEFRARFWQRVRQANRLYGEETSRPGWKTDMGKMHIILGPPDETTRDLMAGGHRGTVIWTYRNVDAPGVGPNTVIAFARDVTGEFRLTTEPSRDADPKQGIPVLYQPPMGTTAAAQAQKLLAQRQIESIFNLTDPLIRQAGGAPSGGPLALAAELAKLQQPPAAWEIRETVTTQEFFGAVPLQARVDFFRTTGSRTLVVITAGVRSSAVHYKRVGGRDRPDLVIYARILDLTGNDLVLGLDDDDTFTPARENETAALDDPLLYQAQALLDPGSYKARFTAIDRAGGRAGSYEIALTVPDLDAPGLEISSLMLARGIERIEENASGAFVMGNLRVLPRLTQTFAPDDDLAFYYQVYGAARDPGNNLPSLDVDYGFYTVAAEETMDLGHVSFAGQSHEAHGYAVPLQDWPAGAYMLRVSVTDRLADTTATREMVFEIR